MSGSPSHHGPLFQRASSARHERARRAAVEDGFAGRLQRVEDAARIEIGTPSRGLALVWAPTGSTVEQVNAILSGEGLSAMRAVYHGYASGFRDLVVFFEDMERDWRGWAGGRVWKSIEGDLRIEARHEHSKVQLLMTLRHLEADPDGAGWTATVDVSIDPGEQLSAIIRDLRTLVAR
jgi:hypothetical protein